MCNLHAKFELHNPVSSGDMKGVQKVGPRTPLGRTVGGQSSAIGFLG